MIPEPAIVQFRPASDADLPYLLALRQRTMDPHFHAAGLPCAESDHWLRIHLRYDCAQLILLGGQPVGLLKLVQEGAIWDLIQLQLAPEVQGSGLGSQLLRQIQHQARQAQAAVQLSVFKSNPALRLYQRVGFVIDGEDTHSYQMRWRPERNTATSNGQP